MNFEQVAILVLVTGLLAAFALQRFRVELVALVGLAAGFALGLVPADDLFSGFASPAVITVVEILLIVQVLARTRAIDAVAARVIAHVRSERAAVVALCSAAALVSIFINNVGALALMLPIALAVCAALGLPMARVLMPMSFATLLGGLCSVVGTPANLLVSQSLAAATGTPLGFFDLATVGLPLTAAGIAWLAWRTPRIPPEQAAAPTPPGFGARRLIAEVELGPRSDLVGLTPGKADSRLLGRVHAIIRDGRQLFGRREHFRLAAGDILLVEAPAETLERLRASGELRYPAGGPDAATVDAVVLPESVVVGSRIGAIAAFSGREFSVVAVAARATRRIEGRLENLALANGDVIVLQGKRAAIDEALAETDVLPLSPRPAPAARPGVLAGCALGAGILAAAVGLLTPEVAFGLVVLVLAVSGALRLREGLEAINWPIVIMLAAMIPLGTAVGETGAAALLAERLVALAPYGPPLIPGFADFPRLGAPLTLISVAVALVALQLFWL